MTSHFSQLQPLNLFHKQQTHNNRGLITRKERLVNMSMRDSSRKIKEGIELQEKLGIDILVHGEFEQ